jgi:transcriptional regulator with XRE-family HTH domain
MTRTQVPWLALRQASGLSQREVERRAGWTKHGRLSWIERGVVASPEEEADLRRVFGEILLNQAPGELTEAFGK